MSWTLQTIMWMLISGGCLWLIVSPSIKTGICITTGLWLLATGNVANIDPDALVLRAYQLRLWGVLLILWGVIWMFLLRPAWLRLSMKWRAAHAGAKWFGLEHRRFGADTRRVGRRETDPEYDEKRSQ